MGSEEQLNEQSYTQGNRAAWTDITQTAMKNLGYGGVDRERLATPPLQIPSFTDDDADRAFREYDDDIREKEGKLTYERLFIGCQKLRKESQRRYASLERLYKNAEKELDIEKQLSEKLRGDLAEAHAELSLLHKRDEATAWMPSQAEEIIQLNNQLASMKGELSALKSRMPKFLPGDLIWISQDGKIKQKSVREINKSGCWLNQSQSTFYAWEQCFATAEECRNAIPVVVLQDEKYLGVRT